jgi:hypothetical protein
MKVNGTAVNQTSNVIKREILTMHHNQTIGFILARIMQEN